jgi:hypothetical protein
MKKHLICLAVVAVVTAVSFGDHHFFNNQGTKAASYSYNMSIDSGII